MNEQNSPQPQPEPETSRPPEETPSPASASAEGAQAAQAPAAPPVEPAESAPVPPRSAPVVLAEAQAVVDPATFAQSNREVEREMHRLSRRSFLWGAAAITGCLIGWKWLITRPEDGGIPWPFRRALEINEDLARDYFQGSRLAPTFPPAMAQTPRPNGDYGLSDDFDPAIWRLQVIGLENTDQATMMPMPPQAAPDPGVEDMLSPPLRFFKDKKAGDKKSPAHAPADKKAPKPQNDTGQASDSGSEDSGSNDDTSGMTQEPVVMLTLEEIKRLPRVEMVTELKCIEGWSVVVQWAGARFADFVAHYPPAKIDDKMPEYVGMETPDGEYYVGLEMASALHPQTLLCYEMNGQPLPLEHGAPLRLVIPAKYGIKNIKRIGTIRFTNERPKDYWAMLGYDWYAGH